MKRTKERTVAGKRPIKISRDKWGVPHVRAQGEEDLYRGLGYCHGSDRALQALLLRIIVQGKASEILSSGDEMLSLDIFFRRLNLSRDAGKEVAKMPPEHLALVEAYCNGMGIALEQRVPWELRLLRYRPEPWTASDCVAVSRVIGYVALAQSQGEMERLFLEMLQGGVAENQLEELFPGQLAQADVGLLRKVKLAERLVPQALRWNRVLPRALASNNWVISGRKTASGTPILANDPHLEANRLPAVWYEVVLEMPGVYCLAATMPGAPGLLLGRTNDLAWGATYTFMDAIDSWIEDCRDGCYRRADGESESWVPFARRKEVIKRKHKPAVTVTFYENRHGVLDGDPSAPGLYLTTRWSAAAGTGARSISAFIGLLHARDVTEAMELVGRVETAWNWVLADSIGNIGYQMSGLMPIRRNGWDGFIPQPGWDPANDWRGFVAPERLPRQLNPDAGFIVTANNNLNHLGREKPINLPMGPYRAKRIEQLLAGRDNWTVAETASLQLDLYSRQAAQFLEILRPLLSSAPGARVLAEWDCRYDVESPGASLFECFYHELIIQVFGQVCGREVIRFMLEETGVLADFYYNFDRILLSQRSAWFGGQERDSLFRQVAAKIAAQPAKPWGEERKLMMSHLLLGGRLPRWMGFDYGPLPLPGSRATVRQGQIYRSGGRQTSFAPSYRFVTDLGEPAVHTSLAGGPSDRRFSRWYTSGIKEWAEGRMKLLRPGVQ